MKQCPLCRRTYTDEYQNFCLDDGAELRSMSIHSTDPTVVQTSPNAPTLVQTSANESTLVQTIDPDPAVVQTSGNAPPRATVADSARGIPLMIFPTVALIIAILAGGALWWRYRVEPRSATSESTLTAVKVGNELRDEYRRAR